MIDEDTAYAADKLTLITEQRDLLRAALAGLVGAEKEDDLRSMEAITRLMPAPEADKIAMLNAIHALLKVCEND